ncbi:MAG: hypothetical protein Q8K60_09130, partial [Parachlamydiaceae bacterium]|nr:hypothetical protein [Parachlamydiaceae bacterium]
MLGKNFKRFGSLTLIFIFIISIIFYDVIVSHLFEWSLKRYTLANFGYPLHCEKIEYKNSKWKIYKPYTEHGSKFQAEKMSFSFSVNLWERKLNMHLSVDHPEWCFKSNFSHQQEKLEKLANQSGKWFQVVPSINIQHGKISSIHPDHLNMRIFFDFIMNQHDGIIFNMNFDPSKSVKPPLRIQATNSDHLAATFFFDDLFCDSLIELGKFLNVTQSSLAWLSGKINGEIQGIFT